MRSDIAATKGHADILKHLIEKEGANLDFRRDGVSLFHSHYPAEFVKDSKLLSRDQTLIGHAARAGHVKTVKSLLDANKKHDHAIEFAAMCGSRKIVRLLWEHGQKQR